jgi:RHS repeat-associated protein
VYDLKRNFYYGVTNIYDNNGGDSGFPVAPGQLYKTIDSEGYTKYGYDVRGRKVIEARYLAKNGKTYTNQYSYDDMDRVRSVTYPNGGPVITNIYDLGANLSKVQLLGGAGTTYYYASQFTPLDQVETISYGNGLMGSYSYYANSARLKQATTGSLQNLQYAYDAVGDVTSITDGIYAGTPSAGITSGTVSYDDLHRLLGFTRASGQTVSCTYDATGDMLSYSENGSSSYTYGSSGGLLPHAVRTANGLNYAYDLCGNMLVRGKQSLVYNPENRLIAAVASNQVTTFGYDAAGSRLWKQGPGTNTLQVWIGGNYEEKDGEILYHVLAGKRLVYTSSSNGTLQLYYHPDHLHSAEIISTNTAATLAQHYEFGAYGSSRYTYSASAFPVSRRYTSQVIDDETGLYYYGARYYDPILGRFIQPDTVLPNEFDPQAYDRYAYARDNPLLYVDPTGHAWAAFTAQFWKDLGHRVFIGERLPDAGPQSKQALMNAAGIGNTPLTDQDGNVISPGDVTIQIGEAVATAPVQAAMLLGGGGEAKGAYEVGDELLKGKQIVQEVVATEKEGVQVVEQSTSLEQRAQEIHSELDPQAQRMRTTAVTDTEEGVRVVSSSEERLSPAQRAALKPGEVEGTGAGHAETTSVDAAKQMGLTPTTTAASRPICPTCAEALKQAGVTPASPLKVVPPTQ